jgi:hypothetical protein
MSAEIPSLGGISHMGGEDGARQLRGRNAARPRKNT